MLEEVAAEAPTKISAYIAEIAAEAPTGSGKRQRGWVTASAAAFSPANPASQEVDDANMDGDLAEAAATAAPTPPAAPPTPPAAPLPAAAASSGLSGDLAEFFVPARDSEKAGKLASRPEDVMGPMGTGGWRLGDPARRSENAATRSLPVSGRSPRSGEPLPGAGLLRQWYPTLPRRCSTQVCNVS